MISEEELILLYQAVPRPTAPLSLGVCFELETTPDSDCEFLFRFKKADIVTIAAHIRLPERLRVANGSVFAKSTALCILLRRLAFPGRYGDLAQVFGRQRSELSMIFNYMATAMWRAYGCLLTMSPRTMPESRLKVLAAAVAVRDAPLPTCVGFVDGTVRGISRPGQHQREVYNGHKRKHALKFQGVMAADGMFCDVFGPVVGRRHDMYMLHRSRLLHRLQNTLVTATSVYCIYGDPAYVLRPVLQIGFRGSRLTQAQAEFNAAMSAVRVSVEWGFANVTNLWAFLDLRRNLRLGLSPVGLYYLVGMLLSNMRNCVRPNEISTYFGVDPMTLGNYLDLAQC
jgi:hypothetical protein